MVSPGTLLGISALLVFSTPVDATVLGRQKTTCPVCNQQFEAVVLASVDTSAGVDRDLFARSAGPQPVFHLIATCPRCYYSGYVADDFRQEIRFPKGFVDQVLTSPKLNPGMTITPTTDQRMIPAAVRYRLADQCYRWRGMSDESMAWLCLRASWVARDRGSILPRTDRLQRVMGFIERWLPPDDRTTNQADRELELATRLAAELAEGRFTRYQVPYVKFVLAMMWRRHGENDLFELLLPPGKPIAGLSPLIVGKIEQARASIGQERTWQQRARECFHRALDAGEIAPRNQGPACYILAELYRRLDQANRAIRYYDLAMSKPDLDAHLADWARQQRQQVLSMESR
ncbi:MAG: DUF2225 domain-containing protein [Phycisphaerae bacterium]|nr:DUF2225 domain-containing protein [Phycisphaerae bacterium]